MTSNAEKAHCIHGHPFDEANTRWTSRGQRDCRACARAREHRLAADPVYRQHKRSLDRERQLDPARRARKTAQERESYRARSLAKSLVAKEKRASPAATHCARPRRLVPVFLQFDAERRGLRGVGAVRLREQPPDPPL
jgi:hypothetical protein